MYIQFMSASHVMRSVRQCHPRRFSVALIAAFVMTFAAADTAPASGMTAVWLPESGDRAVFSMLEAGRAPCDEILRVGRGFYDFCRNWIEQKNTYARQSIRTRAIGSGFESEYNLCRAAHDIRVTRAAGCSMYVGLLRYVEQVHRSTAGSAVEAASGSFAVAAESPVTEIFMFIDGQWSY